jgi:hypothetical protein
MPRKTNTLIIALGVLVLLGAVYYWSVTWNSKKSGSVSPSYPYTPSPSLGNLQSPELVKIEINGLALEKSNGTWKLVSLEAGIPPGKIELDQSEIQYMAYSLSCVWVDQVIDEAPSDLLQYGLDKPVRACVTDSAGQKAEYLLGDMNPSRTSYYIMEAEDPRVYSVSSYASAAMYMRYTLDNIRQRSLFPYFESSELIQLRVESSRFKRIEISIKPETPTFDFTGLFSTHLITSPYTQTRGVNSETFDNLVAPFNKLSIADFADDAPSSLKPYGLDDPVRIFLQTKEKSLDLLIGGNDPNGKRYAKLAGAPGVFTLSGMENVVNIKPFTLINKFVLLAYIERVDHLTITGGEKNLSADFKGTGDDRLYYLNGKKTETDSFKNFYQAVIGLLVDAEYPGPARQQSEDSGELTIEYTYNNPPGERRAVTLVPYNRDFYALKQDGATEFLISRNQVRRIYETAGAVIYEGN